MEAYKIQNFTWDNIELEFSEENKNFLSASIEIDFHPEQRIRDWEIEELSSNFEIRDDYCSIMGFRFQNISATRITDTKLQSKFRVRFDASEEGFKEFSKRLVKGSDVQYTMKTEVIFKGKQFTEDSTQKLPFKMTKRLRGFNLETCDQLTIKHVDINDGTNDYITVKLRLDFISQSELKKIFVPSLELDLFYDDCNMGPVIIHDFSLNSGPNNFMLVGHFKPEASKEKGRQFMSKFLLGEDSDIILRGKLHSTNITCLQDAMKAIKLNVKFPGFNNYESKIINYIEIPLTTSISHLALSYTYANIELFNPFNARLTILHIEAEVYATEDPTLKIATIEEEVKIKIEGNQKAKKERLQINYNLSNMLGHARSINSSSVECKIKIKVGEYLTQVNYKQSSVPSRITFF